METFSDLDAWVDKLSKCEFLSEDQVKSLCEKVRDEDVVTN